MIGYDVVPGIDLRKHDAVINGGVGNMCIGYSADLEEANTGGGCVRACGGVVTLLVALETGDAAMCEAVGAGRR